MINRMIVVIMGVVHDSCEKKKTDDNDGVENQFELGRKIDQVFNLTSSFA